MSIKLIIATISILSTSAVYAEANISIDELSTTSPKATIEVETTAEKEVNISSQAPAEVRIESKNEIDKELAEMNPNIVPEPVVDVIKKEEPIVQKEVVKKSPQIESKATTLQTPPAAKEKSLDQSVEVILSSSEMESSSTSRNANTKNKITASEQIKIYRQKMEARNMSQINKRIEEIRIRQELILAKKLQETMNQTIKAIDGI